MTLIFFLTTTSQTSLFLTSLPDTITEESIRSFYLSISSLSPSSIKSIVIVPTSRVAFVNFIDRSSAEIAAQKSSIKVIIDGAEVKCQWGRSRPKKTIVEQKEPTGPLSVIAQRELASDGK